MSVLFLQILHRLCSPQHSVSSAQRGGQRGGHQKKAKPRLQNGARVAAQQTLYDTTEEFATLLRSQLVEVLIHFMWYLPTGVVGWDFLHSLNNVWLV